MKSKIIYDEELELIDSGSFIHYKQEIPVTISISEDDGVNINIRLEFVYDKTAEEESFKFSQYNNSTLQITVKHKGQLANYGYINPVNVGSFNGYELLFNIRIDINNIGDNPLISYSWFKGKKQ